MGSGPISNAVAGARWDVAVARKQLDAIEQQGQSALALIQAAAPAASAPQNVAAGVASQLNVVA